MIRRGSLLSNAWLVSGASLATVAVLVLLLWSMGSRPREASKSLRLFCAAGISKPMQEIIREYAAAYDVTIQPDYGGTGDLLASIAKIGVPGDLFISADSTTMRDAQKDGIVVDSIPIASMRTVLIVNRKTQEKLQSEKEPVAALTDLLRDDLKVVLAQEGAAIGKVGKSLLQAAGLWDQLEERRKRSGTLVSNVPTVNKVVESVSTRDGFIGLAWDAVAKQFPNIVIVPLPPALERTEHYEIGVLTKSANPQRAWHFARYVTARDKGLVHAKKHHFQTPADADAWEDPPRVELYAGAMLKPGLEDVIRAFAEREGIPRENISPDYQGCGLLVTKMKAIKQAGNGKHFPDAYVSCDTAFTDMVQDYFDAGTIIARNDLVLIVPKGNPKDIQSLEDLKREDVIRIGLPHPKNSAMGSVIVKLFERLGFPETAYQAILKDKTPNMRVVNADTGHMLVNQINSLDIAIVARSNALGSPASANRLDVVELRVDDTQLTQVFSIARETGHKYLMERLLRAVMSPAGRAKLRSVGFAEP